MADAEPSLAELIRRALESRLAQVRVSMPGAVVSYDADTKTATVQPALSDVVFNDEDERVVNDLGPIQNVPVVWPSCGALSIHANLEAGDTGDLVFATNSISDWQISGQVAAPGDLRLHPLGSAKFYPGLRHEKNTLPDTDESIGVPGGLRLKFEEDAISATEGGTPDSVVLAGGALTGLGKALSYILNAGVTAGGPGAPNFTAALLVLTTLLTTPPDGSAWRAAVASGKLKADP
jgi:hypothetical protein